VVRHQRAPEPRRLPIRTGATGLIELVCVIRIDAGSLTSSLSPVLSAQLTDQRRRTKWSRRQWNPKGGILCVILGGILCGTMRYGTTSNIPFAGSFPIRGFMRPDRLSARTIRDNTVDGLCRTVSAMVDSGVVGRGHAQPLAMRRSARSSSSTMWMPAE
jgi:hypothetical protein